MDGLGWRGQRVPGWLRPSLSWGSLMPCVLSLNPSSLATIGAGSGGSVGPAPPPCSLGATSCVGAVRSLGEACGSVTIPESVVLVVSVAGVRT